MKRSLHLAFCLAFAFLLPLFLESIRSQQIGVGVSYSEFQQIVKLFTEMTLKENLAKFSAYPRKTIYFANESGSGVYIIISSLFQVAILQPPKLSYYSESMLQARGGQILLYGTCEWYSIESN